MITMLTPSASWVARYNHLKGKVPGIYAMDVESQV